uniref:LysM domain receptor-like kinase 4 n=1 Tax=Rhizophora mucronata TaxID=61149 RepID=A0A2P2P3N8_RHIMU
MQTSHTRSSQATLSTLSQLLTSKTSQPTSLWRLSTPHSSQQDSISGKKLSFQYFASVPIKPSCKIR